MSEIGYYRYKTTVDVYKQINIVINGAWFTKYISPVNTCEGDLIIKYLDKNGQYRFYPFNSYYRTSDQPELIGTANRFVTNILSDQSEKQNIGFRNKRRIEMSAEVPNDELDKLVDIYSSPRVYLYIGDGSGDTAEDWVEVNQTSENPVVKRRKTNTGKISITIELPENFTIKMI